MNSHVRKEIFYTILLAYGGASFGEMLQASAGTGGLAAWAGMALSGAIIGVLVWLLHKPLDARLAGPARRRAAATLAGALAGAATGTIVTVLLRAPIAASIAFLSESIGAGAGIGVGTVVWLVPALLLIWSRRIPDGGWPGLVALAILLPAFYGWIALRWIGLGNQTTHLVVASTATGALTGLFGPNRQDGSLRIGPAQE